MYLQTLPNVPGWGRGRGQNNCPRLETTVLIFKKTAAPCHDKGFLFTLEANRCCPIYTPSRPQTPSSSWLTDPQEQIPHWIIPHPAGRVKGQSGEGCWGDFGPRPLSLLQRGLAPRSKGKARAELRPARRQARLPHSRSLLLPGRER